MMYGVSMSKDGTTKVVAQALDHPVTRTQLREGRGDEADDLVVVVPAGALPQEPDGVG
jgi:hypothetical protein